jgi:hypothetical protein
MKENGNTIFIFYGSAGRYSPGLPVSYLYNSHLWAHGMTP